MATKSKKPVAKKPAAKGKPAAKKPAVKSAKPAAKKPAMKSAKPAAKKAAKPAATGKGVKPAAPAAAPVDDGARRELEAARATIMRLTGELHASRADGERFQADHERAGQQARDQQVELDKLRADAHKSAADLAAANRRAEEATRRAADSGRSDEATRKADEATRGAAEATRKADEATRSAAEATRKADEATRKADEATRKLEEATRRADEADRRAVAADRERGRIAGELMAARAEMTNYKLRCPKCGKNFVEENFEGITIDRCTGCDAVYFDAGEVDQLLAAVQEKMANPSADPQQTSGWFRNMFKRKPKAPATGGESPPPA